MTDAESNAAFETVVFAKSNQKQPSSRMVAAVNAFFRAIDPNEGQKAVESAVGWREIAAQRLLIGLIKDLSKDELTKAENALKSIAGTFASVRWVGGDWKAFVARDGQTAEKVIDEQMTKDFKSGRLSMGALIDRIYPNGIPSGILSPQEEQHNRGCRR